MRRSLIFMCEAHFAILYILQLNLISRKLEEKGSISFAVLSPLGVGFVDRKSLVCLDNHFILCVSQQLSIFHFIDLIILSLWL